MIKLNINGEEYPLGIDLTSNIISYIPDSPIYYELINKLISLNIPKINERLSSYNNISEESVNLLLKSKQQSTLANLFYNEAIYSVTEEDFKYFVDNE